MATKKTSQESKTARADRFTWKEGDLKFFSSKEELDQYYKKLYGDKVKVNIYKHPKK